MCCPFLSRLLWARLLLVHSIIHDRDFLLSVPSVFIEGETKRENISAFWTLYARSRVLFAQRALSQRSFTSWRSRISELRDHARITEKYSWISWNYTSVKNINLLLCSVSIFLMFLLLETV